MKSLRMPSFCKFRRLFAAVVFLCGGITANSQIIPTQTKVLKADLEVPVTQVIISREAFNTKPSDVPIDIPEIGKIDSSAIQVPSFSSQDPNYVMQFEKSKNAEQLIHATIHEKVYPSQTLKLMKSDIDLLKENILESARDITDHLDKNEIGGGQYYNQIQPTKSDLETIQGLPLQATQLTEEITDDRSGEENGAPRGRALLSTEPHWASALGMNTSATQASVKEKQISIHNGDERKGNPDIQDIITGIVKLLNGNVKVQAGVGPPVQTGIRPPRPLGTRINNRGPPRITDLPEIMPPPPPPTRIPPPYPFDRPPLPPQPAGIQPASNSGSVAFVTGVPIPEQVVPISGGLRPHGSGSRPQRPHVSNNRRPSLPTQTKPASSTESEIMLDMEKPVEEENNTEDKTIPPVHITSTTEFHSQKNEMNIELDNTEKTDSHTNVTDTKNDFISKINGEELKGSSLVQQTTVTPTFIKISKEEEQVNVSPVNEDNDFASQKIVPTKVAHNPIESSIIISTTPRVPITTTPIVTTTTEVTKDEDININTKVNSTDKLIDSSSELLGVGVAVPLESSMNDWPAHHVSTAALPNATTKISTPQHTTDFGYHIYKPRPGIVLDDTEYKPSQAIVTAAGEIFDVTVSAIQGPGGNPTNTGKPHVYPVEIEGVHLPNNGNGDVSVITTPEEGQHFVSIDGKRTYINLFGSTTEKPGAVPSRHPGSGFAVTESPPITGPYPATARHPFTRRPNHPTVRIDTCIVGDDSTCDIEQNEMCRTEQGVSSCQCRPGFSRRKHREPCRRIVSMLLSLRIDRMYDKHIVWNHDLQDPNSEQYQQIQWEASRAIESAMSMTPFSDDFMGANVNSLYATGHTGPVFANVTLQLDETDETLRPAVRLDIQRHLLGVIQRRGNNVGASSLWVDNPPEAVSGVIDVDECSQPDLHDCHLLAECSNVFGTFHCACTAGLRDPWAGHPHRSGRQCEACPADYCNSRGECRFEAGQQVCHCSSNFYGSQCEIDGEVLGVAVGASLAAVIIIVLTLVLLCMWSRRWSREQKTAAGMGSPVFGYMGTAGSTVKTPTVGAPPYQVSIEDRLRWAQIADVMAQANHYAIDPMNAPTRASSAMFSYPTLAHSGQHTMSIHGTRTVESSSSGEEDRADLLGRNFHVPRPKSRSSMANQSGIYYDVEYEQGDIYGTKQQTKAIPLSTYSIGRASCYRQ